MSTMTRHLHVLLDEDRWHRLEVEATRRQVSVAAVVRDAIDVVLAPTDLDQRRAAADAIGDGLAATTTVEVIQEFVHVRSRRAGRETAIELGRRYLRLLRPLLAP